MAKKVPVPTRQVHLDFHTGPWIPDVGRDFDAKTFAKTFKDAHVNSVTVFAKCHHGHLYYNTRRPERHPGLKPGLNLLGEQVEALHSAGIRAPIYLSVQCDEYAANVHPEWIALNPDGTHVGRKPLGGESGWQILDMASDYQDFLAEQTAEVLKMFKPVDGIFFDMCWDQPSVSNFAKAKMAKAGLDPAVEADRKKFAHDNALAYMKRFYDMVKAASPNAGCFFNGRSHANLAEEAKYQAQIEIEALPTGGWGYLYFPKFARIARTFDKPMLGMTARFHKSWADFGGLKPYPALEYETSQMMALGASCSVGDQLHPRGTLDDGAYELIGEVYARVEAAEPWLEGAKAVTDIAVLQNPRVKGAEEGAVRLLNQLRQQFNILPDGASFDGYKLVIAPDGVAMDAAGIKRLRSFVKSGGAVLLSGTSGMDAEGTGTLLPEMGIKAHGMSPFTTTYLRMGREIDAPKSDHVMYERGVRVTADGAEVLAKVVEPYFERAWDHFSSHYQTPGDKLSKFAAATIHGRVGYIAFPIFSAMAHHGNYPYRLLVAAMLERLLPEPLLRVDGPTYLETSVMRQSKPARTIVHLLGYSAERRTPTLDLIEDIVPLYDLPLSLRMDRKPKRVYLAPAEREVEFEHLNGRVNLRVPMVSGHQMIVFE